MMRTIARMLTLMMLFCLAMTPGMAENADVPVVALRVMDYGDIYLELYPEIAPATVENFLKLIDSGFYNGLTFHRIISGFMAQGGDPLGNGTGSSEETIRGEVSSNGVENTLKHERGVLSMARSSDPNSASCQFFIMHEDATHLDGNYAAFGRVMAGMDAVDAMCMNAHVTDGNGTVPKEDQPVITEAVRVERAEAEAAVAREAENGAAGGRFEDAVSGVSFQLPEGWALKEKKNGNYLCSDGSATFSVSTVDVWRRLGKSAQEQYVAAGRDREQLGTEAFDRTAFASATGTDAETMTEKEVNGILWLASGTERNGENLRYFSGATRGTVIMLGGTEGAAEAAMETVLESITVK